MSEESASGPAAGPSSATGDGLPAAVTVLERGGRTFYLLGTAHVSRRSIDDVEALIEKVQPDTVCVELCATRHQSLIDASRWEKLDIFQVIRQRKVLFLLAHLALWGYQRRIGDQFGVKPGAELLAAVEAAEKAGARLVLADRDIQVTLSRTWRRLGFIRKIQLLSATAAMAFTRHTISEEEIETLKDRDHLSEALRAFAQSFPQVKEPLIDERDDYLMSRIAEAPGDRIVAVVGAGHVAGIVERFGAPVNRSVLETVPPPGRLGRALKWAIPIAVVGAFGIGFSRHEFAALDAMLVAWILPNALFAALGAAIAAAKPLTVLTAAVASPLTSLNPAINTGVVAGFVEAWLRRPTVEDCQRLQDDARSWRGVYRNRFTRVLLVSAFATVGSALGAYVGIGWLIRLVVR